MPTTTTDSTTTASTIAGVPFDIIRALLTVLIITLNIASLIKYGVQFYFSYTRTGIETVWTTLVISAVQLTCTTLLVLIPLSDVIIILLVFSLALSSIAFALQIEMLKLKERVTSVVTCISWMFTLLSVVWLTSFMFIINLRIASIAAVILMTLFYTFKLIASCIICYMNNQYKRQKISDTSNQNLPANFYTAIPVDRITEIRV